MPAGLFRLSQHAQGGIDDLVGVDAPVVEALRLLGQEGRVGPGRLHAQQHPLHVHHLLADEDFHAGHLLLQGQVIVGQGPHLIVELPGIEHRQPGHGHHHGQQDQGDAEDLQADGAAHGSGARGDEADRLQPDRAAVNLRRRWRCQVCLAPGRAWLLPFDRPA
jgi:hypothetical protein